MFGDNIPVINNAQYGNNHGREICKLQRSVWDITLKLIVLEYNKRRMQKKKIDFPDGIAKMHSGKR